MKKRLHKEFQHNIPPKRPSTVFQVGVSVLRIVCVPPAGIPQQVLQPEQTDIDVDVHVKKMDIYSVILYFRRSLNC